MMNITPMFFCHEFVKNGRFYRKKAWSFGSVIKIGRRTAELTFVENILWKCDINQHIGEFYMDIGEILDLSAKIFIYRRFLKYIGEISHISAKTENFFQSRKKIPRLNKQGNLPKPGYFAKKQNATPWQPLMKDAELFFCVSFLICFSVCGSFFLKSNKGMLK